MEKNTLNLIDNLKELNVNIISNLDDLNNIIDISELKKNKNVLKVNEDVVIFFDSQSFNNNTFTDNILKFLTDFDKLTFSEFSKMFNLDNSDIKKESEFYNSMKTKITTQVSKTKIYYCNEFNVFKEILGNFFTNKTEIQSTVLSFKNYNNDKENDSFIDYESLNVLNIKSIIKVFLNLNNLK